MKSQHCELGKGWAGPVLPLPPRDSSLGKVSLEELKRIETNSKPAWPLSSHVTLEPPLAVTGPSLCNPRAVVRLAGEAGEWGMCNSGSSVEPYPPGPHVPVLPLCLPHSWPEHRLPAGVGTDCSGAWWSPGAGARLCQVPQRPFSAAGDTQVCSFTCFSTAPPHCIGMTSPSPWKPARVISAWGAGTETGSGNFDVAACYF